MIIYIYIISRYFMHVLLHLVSFPPTSWSNPNSYEFNTPFPLVQLTSPVNPSADHSKIPGLVNIQKTMEHHHFELLNPLFLWAIFNSFL